jgi:hypothetical protein
MTSPTKPYLKHMPYLAIELEEDQDTSVLQALSPKIMQWSDNIWLLDLDRCASYWQHRAERSHLSNPETKAQQLHQHHVPDETIRISSFFSSFLGNLCGETYRATLAPHPWQALLMLCEMGERHLQGLLVASSPFGQSLLHDLSWESWWSCATALMPHLTQTERRRWNPAVFRRQCRDLRRAAQRLGLSSAGALRSIPTQALVRRFGAILGELRDWTYGPDHVTAERPKTVGMRLLFQDEDTDRSFSSGFPWHSVISKQNPTITRHLETPLREWDHMEPLLRDDFDRLCLLDSWSTGERIVSLEWRLTLSDLTPLMIPLYFRHPHALHSEQGSHKTALLQAFYAFENIQRSRRKRPRLRDGYEPIPTLFAIASWELCITERLTLPRQSLGLFGDQSTVEDGLSPIDHQLLRLENKLSIPLTAFDLRSDWLPEDSFAPVQKDPSIARVDSDAISGYAHSLAVSALSKNRPLFLYREPELLVEGTAPKGGIFNERTMHKWWDTTQNETSDTKKVLQRDYYRIMDRQHRSLWIYRNSLGQHFVHGIFG